MTLIKIFPISQNLLDYQNQVIVQISLTKFTNKTSLLTVLQLLTQYYFTIGGS